VDDRPQNQELIAGYLEDLELDVVTAVNGDEALRAANPKVTLVSITAYGQDGPYAGHTASDFGLVDSLASTMKAVFPNVKVEGHADKVLQALKS